MIFSGNRYRSLVLDNKFSADFDLSFSNATGRSEIGFSGENKRFLFSFLSGKVFDHEGRYFYSYTPNRRMTLSTEFSGKSYGYSVDDNRVLFSGAKDDFYVDRFFVNTTGCDVDASVSIFGYKPSFYLSLNSSFVTGDAITGYFVSDSVSGVRIFTGQFDSGSNLYFSSLPTGLIKSGSSGQAIIKQIVTGMGDFFTSVALQTTAGAYNQGIRISGVAKPFINYIFNFDGPDTLNGISDAQFLSGVQKIGQADLNYGFDTNQASLVPSSLPIDISLSYYSGNTGYYGKVASVSLISGGFGYLSAPTIIFSGGLTGQEAKGSLLTVVGDYLITSDSSRFPFPSGEPIRFWKKGSNTLPTPIQENYTYYIKSVFTGAVGQPDGGFQVSTGLGSTALDITSTGSGAFYYYSLNQLPSATAILGTSTSYGSIESIQMNSYGSGYTSAPIILFSGGTGILNNNDPVVASGVAEMAIYTKSFSGFFNLYTGYAGGAGSISSLGSIIPDGMIDYRANSFFSGNKYLKTGISIPGESLISVIVSYTPSFDEDIMVSKLLLSGISGNVIERYITGVK